MVLIGFDFDPLTAIVVSIFWIVVFLIYSKRLSLKLFKTARNVYEEKEVKK